MAKQLTLTTLDIIEKVYNILGVQNAPNRALSKTVIIFEPGKPVFIHEETIAMSDVPDPLPAADGNVDPADAPQPEVK